MQVIVILKSEFFLIIYFISASDFQRMGGGGRARACANEN